MGFECARCHKPDNGVNEFGRWVENSERKVLALICNKCVVKLNLKHEQPLFFKEGKVAEVLNSVEKLILKVEGDNTNKKGE